eukprot:2710383-Pleurochrysis_carterae.AAC.2
MGGRVGKQLTTKASEHWADGRLLLVLVQLYDRLFDLLEQIVKTRRARAVLKSKSVSTRPKVVANPKANNFRGSSIHSLASAVLDTPISNVMELFITTHTTPPAASTSPPPASPPRPPAPPPLLASAPTPLLSAPPEERPRRFETRSRWCRETCLHRRATAGEGTGLGGGARQKKG